MWAKQLSSAGRLARRTGLVLAVTPHADISTAFVAHPQAAVDIVLTDYAFVPHYFVIAHAATRAMPNREMGKYFAF